MMESIVPTEHTTVLKKPKKKSNFLRQTKRHGKKGNFGQGKKLSLEEYNYYMRVFEQIKLVNGEDKEILVRNFFCELEQKEQARDLACNQIVSIILDEALPSADFAQVLSLSRAFLTDLRPLCIDPFSSHVVQTLLTLALKYSQKGGGQNRYKDDSEGEAKEVFVSVTDEEKQGFCSFLDKVGRFIYNNLEEFVCQTYASHIIRTVLEVCSGVEIQRSAKSSQKSILNHDICKDEGKILSVPSELKSLLMVFALRFKKLPKLPDIMSDACGSAVLQSLVFVLGSANKEECETMVGHLIEHGLPGVTEWYSDPQFQYQEEEGAPPGLPSLFLDSPTTRLLEVMLSWCSDEQYNTIFEQYFKGSIKPLVQYRPSNFAVQRLLSSCKNKQMFAAMYEEVSDCLSLAVEAEHMGIVNALSQACRRLDSYQANCIMALMQLVGCWEPENLQVKFAMLLLRLSSEKQLGPEVLKGRRTPVSLQGSLALQDLLHFKKPIRVVKSLLETSTSELQMMACDPRGCHVIDAFTTSTSVGTKNKEKFIYKFKGTYTALACNKHGSRSLEALWKIATITARTQVCNELVAEDQKLKDNQFGKIIYNNFKVGLFKRGNKADWQELVDKAEKKRKMFDELLKEEEVSEKPKKKKKSKSKEEENVLASDTGETGM